MRLFALTLAAGVLVTFVAGACSGDDDGSSSGNASPDGSIPDGQSSSGSNGQSSGTSGSSGDPPQAYVKLSNESMDVNGEQRSYILGLPTDYDANKKYPLVMVFHGNPGSADGMSKTLPFDGASKKDAILAYPDGIGNNWDLSTTPGSNKDFAFIKVLAAEIAKKYNVDTARVFGSGYSGGGFFLNQLVCHESNVFKAIASHSGGGPFNMDGESAPTDQCHPCNGGSVPTIHTHGKQDNEVGPMNGYYAAQCWAEHNGCSDTDPNNWGDVAPAPCKKAAACSQPVTLCWVEGLGHGQWSEGANVAWSFFNSL